MSSMVQLTLSDVCVDFPIHSAQTKGLINTLIGFKGKAHRRIESEDGGRHFAVHALRNITLDLRNGDRVALIGRNGAGKSTLVPDVENFTELGEYLHLPVRTYSSGMLLRLAFAVATAIATDILLMDEMIGVGDRQFIDKAGARLDALMNSVDILVLASHNEDILRKFCNRAVLLSEGQIVQTGSLDECLEAYKKMT